MRWIAVLVLSASCSAAHAETRHAVNTFTLAAGFKPDPHVAKGQTRTEVMASTLSPHCKGWIAEEADHFVIFRTPFSWMRIFVQSADDTTLLIQTPSDQVMCEDDTYKLNPSIEGTFEAGAYRIWVGGKTAHKSSPYELKFTQDRSQFPLSKTAAQIASQESVTLDLEGQALERPVLRVRSGFSPDPHIEAGRSLLRFPVAELVANANGYISEHAALGLGLERPAGYMRIAAESKEPIFVLVRAPNGKWLFSDKMQKGIVSLEQNRWPQGRYLVWIGGSTKGATIAYRILLTEMRPTR